MSINQRGRKLALTIDNPPRSSIKSSKKDKNICIKEINDVKDETSNELLSKILDTINSNSLNIFYSDSNSDFKKKIDSLNLKFYLETEKYLSNKNRSEKCQTSLFIILFKQINIYIEEIERLNLIIIKRKYDPKKIMERTDEIIKKQNEFLTKEKLIKTLKESKLSMETKLLESIVNEDNLKKEIQELKKENAIFKKQLSQNIDTNSMNKSITNNINNIKINVQKKNSNSKNLLHKLTHPSFHSSTIKYLMTDINKGGGCITTMENVDNNDIYYSRQMENGENSKKRNNSDNSKTVLNNSFKKFEKYGVMKGGKFLFKKYQKNNENINNNNININNSAITSNHHNILKNAQISSYNNLNKKNTIHIKINNNINNNYFGINSSNNIDLADIKPIKTDYILSDLDNYKKGFLYEYNSSILSTETKNSKDKNKINKNTINNFYSKNKDKKGKINLDNENINKKNREKLVRCSSKQITTYIGKNINERKKKQKINI
jgi:hypothetical protein